MKTLTILAIILGIVFLFFIAKAERSLVIKGSEVVPAGIIGIPKTLLDKVNEIKFRISDNGGIGSVINLGPTSAKNFISNTVDKISETIKAPIEDKINDILCPQK